MTKIKIENKFKGLKNFIGTNPAVLWVILIFLTLGITIVIYPDDGATSYNYAKGDIAERDIKAPRDFFIEDMEATEKNRQKTRDSTLIVYDYDPALFQVISERIDKAFNIPRQYFTAEDNKTEPSIASVMNTQKDFEDTLGISIDKDAFTVLFKHEFSSKITETIKKIIEEILQNGVVANKEILLKEEGKGIRLRTIGSSNERIVENLKVYYGPDQSKTMVRIVGDPLLKGVNYNLSNLIVDLCQRLLRPNITMNRNETEKLIKAAESQVKPVLYKIKVGEMILREGERVDEVKMVKLKSLQKQLEKKNIFMERTGAAIIVLCTLCALYFICLKPHHNLQKYHNKNMIFLAMMLAIFLLMAFFSAPIAGTVNMNLPVDIASSSIFVALPLSAGAMTVCLFLGFDAALYFGLLLSLLASIIFSSQIEVFIFFFLSSITGAFWMKDCCERKVFISAGIKLAFFNALIALALNIYSSQPELPIFIKDSILALLGGFTAGIITAGLTPVVEMLFSYTTEIKLLELSNLDQPIMRRLMIEAPGTYNHSVIVASLAEAAASAIQASVLKTKVCAFYHDIGKLDKPLYFIENQTDGKNRHDKLSPSMSALILIQHIKKGVQFAKEHKLGTEIIDTIRQHHGTSLIRYFYNKSVKIHGEDCVKKSDFRYPGPKPQTREAGIVMLADVVEAALRTLETPTSARIQGRVQELINAIFADGQLEECELTLKDLHQIAKSFNKILTGLYHHRIEYTEKPQEIKKEKNGKNDCPSPDSTKINKDIKGTDKPKNPANLKRLGI